MALLVSVIDVSVLSPGVLGAVLFSDDMVPSTTSILSFLRCLRSIGLGHKLRTFILRFLLFWPRIFRNLGKAWSRYFPTSSAASDAKKTEGNTRTPPLISWKREEYSVVCASRAFERADEQRLTYPLSRLSVSDGEEPIQLRPVFGQSSSMPHSPSSSYPPSLQDSPTHSMNPIPTGIPNDSSRLLRSETPLSTMELIIHRSSTPVSGTNPRAASRQFTGTSSRSRSRRPSPSPSTSLFRRPFSRPDTPSRVDIEVPARPTPDSHGSPENSAHSPTGITVQVEQPSAPASPDPSSSSPSRLSAIRDQMQSFPMRPQHPSTESVNSSADSSRSRGQSPSVLGAHRHARLSQGSLRPPSSSSQLIQAPHEPSFAIPEASVSRVTIQILATTASNTPPRPEQRFMIPMYTDKVSRYMKKGDVPRKESEYSLAALEVDFSYRRAAGEWVQVIHPGGALYFYHERLRIFTDVYMYDHNLRQEVLTSAKQLDDELRLKGMRLPDRHDLVIDRGETKDKKKIIWQYYYVDHDNKTLFWLEPYPMGDLLCNLPGVKEPGHIKLRLESLYWTHWSLYPVGYAGRNFRDDASKELLGVLLSSSIDSLTSKLSTAPYSVADMQTMRDLIKEAKDLGTENADAINSIARLLSICAQWRFVHFHGQKTSRQNRHKSIYEGDSHESTILIWVFSPLLFFLPDLHLRELTKLWADELVIEEFWKNFMRKLVSEWVEFVLYATVMLAANVAFLAIQGVVVMPPSGNGWIRASPAQISSSISLVFSIGSIITGLLLIRRNRSMAMQDTQTAWHYLNSMKKPVVYLEPLAIMFSLTYALLMWSVCAFFVAVLFFSFQGTTTLNRVYVGVASGIVSVLIFWCIVNSWDSGEHGSEDYELIDELGDEEHLHVHEQNTT